MIYKHLGQRRQVAGIESDAGCIRTSGKVEHRIENATLAPSPGAMQHQGMLCVPVWAPAESSRLLGGCIYLDDTKAVALTS